MPLVLPPLHEDRHCMGGRLRTEKTRKKEKNKTNERKGRHEMKRQYIVID